MCCVLLYVVCYVLLSYIYIYIYIVCVCVCVCNIRMYEKSDMAELWLCGILLIGI